MMTNNTEVEFKIEDGVLYDLRGATRTKVGASLRVKRKIDRDDRKPTAEIEFDSLIGAGKLTEIGLREAQDKRLLLGELSKAGYGLPTNEERRAALFLYVRAQLIGADTEQVRPTNGWFTTGKDESRRWTYNYVVYGGAQYTSGTIKSWKKRIGKLLQGNPYLIFMVAVAFAGPLLRHLRGQSVIFALIGRSRTGKSTCTGTAGSVFHSPETRRSWHGTRVGLLGFVRQNSDSIAEMDELGEGDPKNVLGVIYPIANESPKLRGGKDGQLVPDERHHCFVMTSGEHDLHEVARRAKMPYDRGCDARFIALPVDAKHPMFPDLHGHADPDEIVDHLSKAAAENYGAVGRAFVSKIEERLNEGLPLGRSLLKKHYAELKQESFEGRKSKQFASVAKHFALAATAGELAIIEELLPLKKGEVLKAAKFALRAWVETQGISAVHAWLRELKNEGKIPLFTGESYADKRIVAFRHTNKKSGARWIIVRPDAAQARFGEDWQSHVEQLRDSGYLETATRYTPIKPVSIPGQRETEGFYVIKREFLE